MVKSTTKYITVTRDFILSHLTITKLDELLTQKTDLKTKLGKEEDWNNKEEMKTVIEGVEEEISELVAEKNAEKIQEQQQQQQDRWIECPST